jgi:hypothetical protein
MMGEYADDLIDSGMMGDNPFGYNVARSRTSRTRVKKPPVILQMSDIIAYQRWFKKFNWSGCSRYEVASLAWHEAVRLFPHTKATDIDDDNFSWWFDEYNCEDSVGGVLGHEAIGLMAWNQAKIRCK